MNSINKISLIRYRIKLTYSPQHTVRHGFPCVQLYKILYHCKANLCQIETLQCKFRVSYSKLSTLSTGCIKHKIKTVLKKKKKKLSISERKILLTTKQDLFMEELLGHNL